MLGVSDEASSNWDGSVTGDGASITRLDPWRFGKDDQNQYGQLLEDLDVRSALIRTLDGAAETVDRQLDRRIAGIWNALRLGGENDSFRTAQKALPALSAFVMSSPDTASKHSHWFR